ncbi:MAG: hypothetical protein WAV47_23270, partial [Blastocatellia bacterium]
MVIPALDSHWIAPNASLLCVIIRSEAERAAVESMLKSLLRASSTLPMADNRNASAIVISGPLPSSLARLNNS